MFPLLACIVVTSSLHAEPATAGKVGEIEGTERRFPWCLLMVWGSSTSPLTLSEKRQSQHDPTLRQVGPSLQVSAGSFGRTLRKQEKARRSYLGLPSRRLSITLRTSLSYFGSFRQSHVSKGRLGDDDDDDEHNPRGGGSVKGCPAKSC